MTGFALQPHTKSNKTAKNLFFCLPICKSIRKWFVELVLSVMSECTNNWQAKALYDFDPTASWLQKVVCDFGPSTTCPFCPVFLSNIDLLSLWSQFFLCSVKQIFPWNWLLLLVNEAVNPFTFLFLFIIFSVIKIRHVVAERLFSLYTYGSESRMFWLYV